MNPKEIVELIKNSELIKQEVLKNQNNMKCDSKIKKFIDSLMFRRKKSSKPKRYNFLEDLEKKLDLELFVKEYPVSTFENEYGVVSHDSTNAYSFVIRFTEETLIFSFQFAKLRVSCDVYSKNIILTDANINQHEVIELHHFNKDHDLDLSSDIREWTEDDFTFLRLAL